MPPVIHRPGAAGLCLNDGDRFPFHIHETDRWKRCPRYPTSFLSFGAAPGAANPTRETINMSRKWKLVAVAAAASLTLAACGGSDSSSDTTAAAGGDSDLKVAVVYLGVPDDKGWTYQHEQGIAAAEQETGVTIKRVENGLDNADSEKTFDQLASEGYDLIFATSFGYGGPMAQTAGRNDWCRGDLQVWIMGQPVGPKARPTRGTLLSGGTRVEPYIPTVDVGKKCWSDPHTLQPRL